MDVKLSGEQEELQRAVRGELQRHAAGVSAPGPAEADIGAMVALQKSGFLDVIASGGSAVDAVLVIEAAATHAPGSPVAARALVGPCLTEESLPLIVALADRRVGAVCRFAAEAEAFLLIDGDEALIAASPSAEVELLHSRWGYPVGRVTTSGGKPLGPSSGDTLQRLWRIGLAAEAAGLMEAAVMHAAHHVSERYQFGKPIGSLQAIQHRLARAHIAAQGAKWLARRAAWDTADAVAAAAAACSAAEGLAEVLAATHQVCGAIGFTDEFGLTRYTARMAMLQTDLGGASAHARALARGRWKTPPLAARN